MDFSQLLRNALNGVMTDFVASGLPISHCTLQRPLAFANPTQGLDAGGAPVTGPGSYVPVSGLQDILCMDAPPGMAISGSEEKKDTEILGLRFRHVLLTGYYPAIPRSNENWQAVITDASGYVETWDLIGSDSDSQQTQTRLQLRIGQI